MASKVQDFEKEFGLQPVVVDVENLIPYARNSRVHTDEQIAQIAASIREFGFVNPIIIDDAMNVKAGHGRLLAARKLGLKKVPCLKGEMSENEWRAYIIADNRLAEKATWDWTMLQTEVQELIDQDFDITLTGFEESMFNSLIHQGEFGEPGAENEDKEKRDQENPYTSKTDKPLYEAKGAKPELKDLYDNFRALKLLSDIQASKLPADLKMFLTHAAYRHVDFNYENIAEYYCHSDKETQQLFEDSALVIVDYDSAIKNSWIKISKQIDELYNEDNPPGQDDSEAEDDA